MDFENPLNGLCILYPEEYGDSHVKLEQIESQDASGGLTYRVSMEYALHTATDRDVVRLSGVGLDIFKHERLKGK